MSAPGNTIVIFANEPAAVETVVLDNPQKLVVFETERTIETVVVDNQQALVVNEPAAIETLMIEHIQTLTLFETDRVLETIVLGIAGAQGVKGDKGDTGDVGPSGTGDKTFTQAFGSIIANVLLVNHGLGKYPVVTVIDSANDEVDVGLEYLDTNNIRITASASFAGMVICN